MGTGGGSISFPPASTSQVSLGGVILIVTVRRDGASEVTEVTEVTASGVSSPRKAWTLAPTARTGAPKPAPPTAPASIRSPISARSTPFLVPTLSPSPSISSWPASVAPSFRPALPVSLRTPLTPWATASSIPSIPLVPIRSRSADPAAAGSAPIKSATVASLRASFVALVCPISPVLAAT